MEGFAVTEGQSQLIPIAKLIDDGNSGRCPSRCLGTLHFQVVRSGSGRRWPLGRGDSTSATLTPPSKCYRATDFSPDARQTSGLARRTGCTPLAVRALTISRSAPPCLRRSVLVSR